MQIFLGGTLGFNDDDTVEFFNLGALNLGDLLGLGDDDDLVLVEGLDNLFGGTSGEHDVNELHVSVLLEILNDLLDGLAELGLLGLLQGGVFVLGDTESQRLLLLLLLDLGDDGTVGLDFGTSGEEGNVLLVVLDELIVVTETTVEDSEGFCVLAAVDSEVFDLLGSRAGA